MKLIIGSDERGRGTWRGNIFACSVFFEDEIDNSFVDSKKTSKKNREDIVKQIKNNSKIHYFITSKTATEVDTLGLGYCNKQIFLDGILLALKKVKELNLEIDEIICDGNLKLYLKEVEDLGLKITSIPKADDTYQEVSCASILAKYTKDKEMEEAEKDYPNYSFINHSGYGTKLHKEKIEKYGVIKGFHRLSYKPLKKYQ